MNENTEPCVANALTQVGQPLCTRPTALRRWFHLHPELSFEEAELLGSIRSVREETRRHIHYGMRRMFAAAAELHNAAIDIRIDEGYPPVVNEVVSTNIARQAVVGDDRIVASEFPSMGSEDYSYYLEKFPGCFVRFGARHPDWEPIPLHSPAVTNIRE